MEAKSVSAFNDLNNLAIFRAENTGGANSNLEIFQKEYLLDKSLVEGGASAVTLAEEKLWSQPLSDVYIYGLKLSYKWQNLKKYLLGLTDQNWQVWTDWYEDRLNGMPLIKEIHIGKDPLNDLYGRTTLPDNNWVTPHEVNSKIVHVIEDYWRDNLSTQNPMADTFSIDENGTINSTTPSTGTSLRDSVLQRQWYDEMRLNVIETLEVSSNKLGYAEKPLNKLKDALPVNIRDAKIPLLWPRANDLRRILARYEQSEKDEIDHYRLDADVADNIRGIVELYNNLRISDPRLLACDTRAISPSDAVEKHKSLMAIQPMIMEIIAQCEVDPLATDSLERIAETGTNSEEIQLHNEIMGRLEIEQNTISAQNFIRSLLVWVRNNKKEAAAEFVVGVTLIEIVARYIPEILEFVSKIGGGLLLVTELLLKSL